MRNFTSKANKTRKTTQKRSVIGSPTLNATRIFRSWIIEININFSSLCHFPGGHDHAEASRGCGLCEVAPGGVSEGGGVVLPLSVVQVRLQVVLGVGEVGETEGEGGVVCGTLLVEVGDARHGRPHEVLATFTRHGLMIILIDNFCCA